MKLRTVAIILMLVVCSIASSLLYTPSITAAETTTTTPTTNNTSSEWTIKTNSMFCFIGKNITFFITSTHPDSFCWLYILNETDVQVEYYFIDLNSKGAGSYNLTVGFDMPAGDYICQVIYGNTVVANSTFELIYDEVGYLTHRVDMLQAQLDVLRNLTIQNGKQITQANNQLELNGNLVIGALAIVCLIVFMFLYLLKPYWAYKWAREDNDNKFKDKLLYFLDPPVQGELFPYDAGIKSNIKSEFLRRKREENGIMPAEPTVLIPDPENPEGFKIEILKKSNIKHESELEELVQETEKMKQKLATLPKAQVKPLPKPKPIPQVKQARVPAPVPEPEPVQKVVKVVKKPNKELPNQSQKSADEFDDVNDDDIQSLRDY